MHKQFQDMHEFHTRFGFQRPLHPSFLDDEKMQVRLNFLLEELSETANAAGFAPVTRMKDGHPVVTFVRDPRLTPNLALFFDGLIDLDYVSMGTAWLCALPYPDGWDMVHGANMLKERVQRAQDSTRGTTWDVRKPPGWIAPDVGILLRSA